MGVSGVVGEDDTRSAATVHVKLSAVPGLHPAQETVFKVSVIT